jgi:glutamate/tyrosine decarboxylase-like PLP-dependent enzyme
MSWNTFNLFDGVLEGAFDIALGSQNNPNKLNFDIILEELKEYFDNINDVNSTNNTNFTKVCNHVEPTEIIEELQLTNLNKVESDAEFIKLLEKIFSYSVVTNNKMFFNQLFAGSDPYSCLSELCVSILNTSMYTYEMAPVFTLMETYLFDRIKHLFGFDEGGDGGDIMVSPGGSLSNILSMHLARYNYDNLIKVDGIYGLKHARIYVSHDSHYSFLKGAMFIGFGKKNIIKIKTKYGKMITSELETQIKSDIESGYIPLMAIGTAGTTVFGFYDNLEEIGKICKKHNIWFHVDAAWGGAVIFSDKHKHKLNGIDYANSLTWNPHKMLRVPLQCSLLLVRDKKIAEECNMIDANESDYLFQSDKYYDKSLDTGKKYVLCGRKVDVLKLWVAWKTRGEQQFSIDIDKVHELAILFKNKINESNKLQIVLSDIESTNVCFWYCPPNKKQYNDLKFFNIVVPKIKEKMVKEGTMMISYQPMHHYKLPNFFRIVFINPLLEEKDLNNVIDLILKYGDEVCKENDNDDTYNNNNMNINVAMIDGLSDDEFEDYAEIIDI